MYSWIFMGWFAVLFLQGEERSWRLSSIIYGQWFNQSCLSNEAFIKPQKDRVWRATWVEDLGRRTHLKRVWKLLSLSLHLVLCSSFIWLLLSCVVCVQLRCHVWLFATPWTIAPQAPLPMRFSRQEYWRGLGCHFLLQGIFLTQGLNHSAALQQILYS